MQSTLQSGGRAAGGGHLLTSISIAALILAGSTAFAQTATTVTISGSVVDDSGVPISGASVHYNNSPATAKDSHGRTVPVGTFVSSHVSTAKDGTFSITGLPGGFIYWLCATGTAQTHLRSCDWGRGSTKVNLTSASSTTSLKLQVPNGVLLTFQVADVRSQIQDEPTAAVNGTPAQPANFRVFIRDGSSLFLAPAVPVSVAANVRHYAVAVPKTRKVLLYLDTRLKVTDQAQTPLRAQAIASTISVTGQPVTVQLNVP